MTKEELKMTSKEALERLEHVLTWDGDIDIDKDLYNLWVTLVCRTIEKDLDRLEKLEKENQELKGKVNYLNKVIEVMKNPSKLDCTHMFDNCKKLTPLPDVEELKITSKEAYGKLDKILNIEEEIGIDLTILFAALKNGVYYFDEEGQLIHSYVWLTDNHVAAGVHDKLSYSFKTPYHETLLFEDYGKTWALSEKELMNEELDKVEPMTYLQEVLIEGMNEFCAEKFDLSYERTKEEAEEYIIKNIDEYKSLTTHNWY